MKRLRSCSTRNRTGVGIGKVNIGGRWLVRKGRIQSSVVNIVTLNALVEYARAAPQHGLAISQNIVGKPDPRFPRVVVVLHVSAGESTHSRFPDSVEIEILAVEGRQYGGVQGPVRIQRIRLRPVIIGGNEIGELVISFESMWHGVVAESQIEG